MATMWKKTLSFLGLVEEYDDEYADLPDEGTGRRAGDPASARPAPEAVAPRPEPSNVRRLPPARSIETTPPPFGDPGAASGSVTGSPGGFAAGSTTVRPVQSAKVHVTNPTTFNEVEEVGERFRSGSPVIMNLQGANEGTAKRLLDFASGLIFGLDGRIERVGDRVFLLTPVGVDVSTEERARLSERGFFNQG